MKFNHTSLLFAGAIAIGLVACEKTLLDNRIPQTYPDPTKTAYVKFIHAYAGKSPALTAGAGPNVFLYIQDTTIKINGGAFTYTTSGGQFPTPSTAVTNARSWYTALPAGTQALYGVLARVNTAGFPAPVAGDTVFKVIAQLDAGRNYTAVLADTAEKPSIAILSDNFGTIDDGMYKVRLANFLAWPGDLQEIYSYREGRVIQTNVGYKQSGAFLQLKVPSVSDTFIVRKVSGPSPAFYADTLRGLLPTAKRAYTFFTRGKQLSGTSTTYQSRSTFYTTNY